MYGHGKFYNKMIQIHKTFTKDIDLIKWRNILSNLPNHIQSEFTLTGEKPGKSDIETNIFL